jgi:hypothetical protein
MDYEAEKKSKQQTNVFMNTGYGIKNEKTEI